MDCPTCHRTLIEPYGPEYADILIAQSGPMPADLEEGIPFRGDEGNNLRSEIFRLGAFKHSECRFTSLWLHQKVKKECPIDFHLGRFLDVCKTHKYVLLMGAEFGNDVVYHGSVTTMGGMRVRVGNAMGVVCTSMSSVEKEGVGELRFALREFAKLIEEGKNATIGS